MQSVRKAHHVHRLNSDLSCLANVYPLIIICASSTNALWLRAEGEMLSCCYHETWLSLHAFMKSCHIPQPKKKIIHGLSWRWSSFSSIRTIPSAVPTSLNWKFRNNIMKRRLRNLYIKDHIALKHKQTLGAVKDGFTQTMVSSTQNDHFTSNHSTVILKQCF